MHPFKHTSLAKIVLACTAAYLLQGCESPSPKVMARHEQALGVESPLSQKFHSFLYFPKGYALHYPGYVLAIQKTERKYLDIPAGQMPIFLQDSSYFEGEEKHIRFGLGSRNLLKHLSNDPKALFVSHIARFEPITNHSQAPNKNTNSYPHIDSCLLYNTFQSPAFYQGGNLSPTNWVDLNGILAWRSCDHAPRWGNAANELNPQKFYSNGLIAVNALAEQAAQDIRKQHYSHVLMIIMGWNTSQDEAFRNFNDITGNLVEAAQQSEQARLAACQTGCDQSLNMPFRPLVIGITWPSLWSENVLNLTSYPVKASDADEVGASWVNLLLNQALPRAMAAQGIADTPIVLVGHSFGARVVASAVAMSPALKPPAGEPSPAGLHSAARLVVMLQGAVSLNRFAPDSTNVSEEGIPLRDFQRLPHTRFVLTAAKNDQANGGPTYWFEPAGAFRSYNSACNDSKDQDWKHTAFRCLVAYDYSGQKSPLAERTPWDGFSMCDRENPGFCRSLGQAWPVDNDHRGLYIDVSNGITEFNSLNSGGNAHSDIYRIGTGRMLWMLIDSLAPATVKKNTH